MVQKLYDWVTGATLEDHSRRKHKILREYFLSYLEVRCQIPTAIPFSPCRNRRLRGRWTVIVVGPVVRLSFSWKTQECHGAHQP